MHADHAAAATGLVAHRSNDRIRPVEERDVQRIARLHERLLGQGRWFPSQSLQQSLAQIILHNPWRRPTIPSLVYEDAGGMLRGFMGIVPRRMSFKGRAITAAISHSFLVEPGSRSSMAAVRLIKQFFSGPQDLALAEGNSISRRLWEGLGGTTCLLYSLRWTRPLRPARYVLSILARRGLPRAAAVPLQYSCDAVDRLAGAAGIGASALRPSPLQELDADAGVLAARIGAVAGRSALRPDYDEDSLRWLLDLMARRAGPGGMRKAVLTNGGQEPVGWYIACRNPAGTWDVMQMAAAEGHMEEVLDHLFFQARRDGALAVTGTLDPQHFTAFASKDCLFHHDGRSPWMLVHARDREILHEVLKGNAFLSRLDGEWWIPYLVG